jgi:hypothetical protein
MSESQESRVRDRTVLLLQRNIAKPKIIKRILKRFIDQQRKGIQRKAK